MLQPKIQRSLKSCCEVILVGGIEEDTNEKKDFNVLSLESSIKPLVECTPSHFRYSFNSTQYSCWIQSQPRCSHETLYCQLSHHQRLLPGSPSPFAGSNCCRSLHEPFRTFPHNDHGIYYFSSFNRSLGFIPSSSC